MTAAHLVKRFFGSLRPGGPSHVDESWVREQLLPTEVDLWERMYAPDRRHAVSVARRTERALGHVATRPVLAAALLHDIGKTVSGLRTYGRVIATLSAKAAGYDMAAAWTETTGFTRKVGLYLQHPELGGDQLSIAGSDQLTIDWARQHHSSEDEWTVPTEIGRALVAADDD